MARLDEGSSRSSIPYRPPQPPRGRGRLSKPGRASGRAGSAAVGRRLSRSRSGGGGRAPIRSNSSGRYSPPASVPGISPGGGAIPDINAFLTGDPGYLQQIREFTKLLNDFSADADRRKGVLDQEYGVSKKALDDQRLIDLEDIEEDYASRGLQRSGLYGQAVGDYEKEFGVRTSELARRQQQALQQLTQERGAYHRQNLLQQQAAREQALRRRAEQYGV